VTGTDPRMTLSSETRAQDRIARLRDQVRANDYVIDPRVVADALLRSEHRRVLGLSAVTAQGVRSPEAVVRWPADWPS